MSNVKLFCNAVKEAKEFSDTQNQKIEYLQKIGYSTSEIVMYCGDNIMRNIALARSIKDYAAGLYNEQILELAEENYAEALFAAAKLGENI